MNSTPISRHFVTLKGRWGPRQVHYRRAGSGPALLLLHQSPQSSREFEPLMAEWGKSFTVFAPDSPGYGLSDPLGVEQAGLEDFADAVAEFLEAIGIERCGVYGYHTGSGMAVALAHQHPQRVTAIGCNGLVMLMPPELEDILANYLPKFEPSWDGAHLAWLWARMREQMIFFPWYDARLAARMDFPMRSPEALQQSVMEFLHAGDAYRVAYRAAFDYEAGPVLAQLTVPSLITAARIDPLCAHLERIDAQADCVKIEASPDHDAAVAKCFAHLLGYQGSAPPDAPPCDPLAGRTWSDTLRTDSGWVRLRRRGQQINSLILHDAGGSAETAEELLAACDQAAAIDLPGHGEAPAPAADCDVAACADAVEQALAALDGEARWLIGHGSGALVAIEVAARHRAKLRGVLVVDPPIPDPELRAAILHEGLPDLDADWHGGHLSRAWHMVRDGRLYHPWFDRSLAGIRRTEPRLDNASIHLEVREHLKSNGHWQALCRDQLDADPLTRAGELTLPLVSCATADGPWQAAARQLAETGSRGNFVELPVARSAWSETLAAAMGRVSG
jgi:pimeloyl-ACP methyl ester carboxylesterase